MNIECEYECDFHRGKVEFHHPISNKHTIGVNLCEAHHSLIQGRKRKYLGECIVNKSLDQMRKELKELEYKRIIAVGASPSEIDKH